MSFEALSGFLAMGGHGLYVWLAFGVTIVVVLANVASVSAARRRFFRDARALERRTRGTVPAERDQTSSTVEGAP